MTIKQEVIGLLKEKKISQKEIDAIHSLIILEEQLRNEHVVLTSDKRFESYVSQDVIVERFL